MMNETIEQWNSAAEMYAATQEESEFVHVNKKVVIERFSELNGKKVLDLGCGYGWYTDYFASVGADAIGCDGSTKMLELAKERYPACSFDCCDIEKPLPYEDHSFDLVFCNQVLMDIENFGGLLTEAFRILRPGGTFYMGIVHPAFYDCHWAKDETGFRYAKLISKYLSEYRFDNEFWGKTAHYHRTISTYLNAAIQNGFRLIHLEEPLSYDGVTKSNEFPLFLFAEFERELK